MRAVPTAPQIRFDLISTDERSFQRRHFSFLPHSKITKYLQRSEVSAVYKYIHVEGRQRIVRQIPEKQKRERFYHVRALTRVDTTYNFIK